MKAIIPVAGAGNKTRTLPTSRPKALTPVAGKPILGFIIERLMKTGIQEFVFVTGHFGDKIHDYVKEAFPQLTSFFVQQVDQKGVGHAIWTCRDLINNEEILIVLGDTIFDADLEQIIASPYSCLGVKKVDDPRQFGVVEMTDDEMITSVIEKPLIPKSNMALVGFYKIRESEKLFETLEENVKNNITTHYEIQLTDAISQMIGMGIPFKACKITDWFDCGKKDSLLATNMLMLSKLGYASRNLPEFENSVIIEPVSIGKNCKIQNSIIGPNVSVSDHSEINHSIIKNSIIGSHSKLEDVIIDHSVVGNDSIVKGKIQNLNMSDSAEIDFS